MALADDTELRRMAQAIDAALEPRLRLKGELSEEGARKLRDVLLAVSADQLIEHSWPLLRMASLLDDALA
jgi:hypothetical protein